MVLWFLLIGLIIVTLINWYAAFFERRKRFTATKPAVMILLITIFLLVGGFEQQTIWFLLAMLFSLAGDVFLLLSNRFFLYGLGAFLLAQVGYLIGFNKSIPPLIPGLIGMALTFCFTLLFYFLIRSAAQSKTHLKRILPAMLIYVCVLFAVTISASLNIFKSTWDPMAAWFTLIGGVLFLSSDIMLALDRFVKRFKLAHGLVMITYHLAQFALIFGILLQFQL